MILKLNQLKKKGKMILKMIQKKKKKNSAIHMKKTESNKLVSLKFLYWVIIRMKNMKIINRKLPKSMNKVRITKEIIKAQVTHKKIKLRNITLSNFKKELYY